MSYLKSSIKILLFLTALTPLVITQFSSDPFVFGKAVFFRTLIEAALILFLIHLLRQLYLKRISTESLLNLKKILKSTLFIFISLFFLSAIMSTLFAVNSFKGLWGDAERGEGLIGFFHYFVFLGLALAIFEKKDWFRFFKISLIVGFILIIAAWLQYFGITAVFGILGPSIQPGSFLGNPAFLAGYLILLIGFAAIVGSPTSEVKSDFPLIFWRYFSIIFGALAMTTIFITSIRGAIVGLGVGVLALLIYFAIRPIRPISPIGPIGLIRLISIGLIGLLIIFSVIFWFTRENKFWQAIPGLGRLAGTSLESLTVITRLLAISPSFEAFKEKPIFGWGLDNYHVAYNKYFDPRYSIYAEDWFDRAHNKILDVLVMQGGIGLLLYLGIFVAAFYLLFKFKEVRPFLIAILIAYFIQNLFVFDNILTYIAFFALLGYLLSASINQNPHDSATNNQHQSVKISINQRLIKIIVIVIVMVITGYIFYFHNFLPTYQNFIYHKAVKTQAMEGVLAVSDKFLYPYTFTQSALRLRFADLLTEKIAKGPEFKPLVDKILFSLEEMTEKEPHEPRFFIHLVEIYEDLARVAENGANFFEKAEGHIRKAMILSPKRQAILHHLSFILSGQGRHGEAIKVARSALDLEPRVAKSHYHLAIALVLAADAPENEGTPVQETYRKEANKELSLAYELGLRDGFATFLDVDLKNMLIIYNGLRDFEEFAKVLEMMISRYPQNKDYRHDAINVYRILKDKEGIIKHAQKLKELDPSLKNKLNEIIERAQKEE
jgi:O-antigen ligase